MIVKHEDKIPKIDETTFVAANAVVCGDVKIGKNCRIMYGATIICEGGKIEIGDNCVILENAVLRSTKRYNLKIGNRVLIGPNTHVTGCDVEDNVFIATGASVFHGAELKKGVEVRINGVVHLKTVLPENTTVPIGWIAVGNPAKIFSPEKHDEIWAVQEPLNFPLSVYGVERGEDAMREIMEKMTEMLGSHFDDEVVG